MSSIQLHLDAAEYDAVSRYAEALGVSEEDVVYAALNRLMLLAENPQVNQDIADTRQSRRDQLPSWAEPAGVIHAAERDAGDERGRSGYPWLL